MQRRSEETRSRILAAAVKQIAARGYSDASVDDICLEAQISKGAFYHHFASKQAMFLDLLDIWFSQVDASLETARQATVPLTLMRMTDYLPGILASARERLPVFLEFWLQANHDPEFSAKARAPYRRYQEYFAHLVELGVAEGSFRPVDPQSTAQMIVSLAAGVFLQALVVQDGTDWQIMIQQSMEIFLAGVAS